MPAPFCANSEKHLSAVGLPALLDKRSSTVTLPPNAEQVKDCQQNCQQTAVKKSARVVEEFA
jgi:hypothetical protein